MISENLRDWRDAMVALERERDALAARVARLEGALRGLLAAWDLADEVWRKREDAVALEIGRAEARAALDEARAEAEGIEAP